MFKIIRNVIDEAKRRANRPFMECNFSDGISFEEFQSLANEAVKSIKGREIEIDVSGPKVSGLVLSRTRLSEWKFSIDFNDYGHITGRYWLRSENDDSKIPLHIASHMQRRIESILGKVIL